MLVISRQKGEAIVINDDITITVVEIRGDKVRLGVEAQHAGNSCRPMRPISVYRAKVLKRMLGAGAFGTFIDKLENRPHHKRSASHVSIVAP